MPTNTPNFTLSSSSLSEAVSNNGIPADIQWLGYVQPSSSSALPQNTSALSKKIANGLVLKFNQAPITLAKSSEIDAQNAIKTKQKNTIKLDPKLIGPDGLVIEGKEKINFTEKNFFKIAGTDKRAQILTDDISVVKSIEGDGVALYKTPVGELVPLKIGQQIVSGASIITNNDTKVLIEVEGQLFRVPSQKEVVFLDRIDSVGFLSRISESIDPAGLATVSNGVINKTIGVDTLVRLGFISEGTTLDSSLTRGANLAIDQDVLGPSPVAKITQEVALAPIMSSGPATTQPEPTNTTTTVVVDAAPTTVNDTFSGLEDATMTLDVLANDTDPEGAVLRINSFFVDPAKGTLSIVDNKLVFTPKPGVFGLIEITYAAQDPAGNSTTGRVELTLTHVNHNPTATDVPANVNDQTATSVNAANGLLSSAADVDVGDVLKISKVGLGTAVDLPPGTPITGLLGTLVINPDGSYTYTPNNAAKALAAGTSAQDVFSYEISDGAGGTTTAKLTLTVLGTNDVPVAFADSTPASDKTNTTVNALNGVLANDTDIDTGSSLTVSAVAAGTGVPSVNNLSNSVNGSFGSLILNPDGSYTYTPTSASTKLAAGQTGVDTFTYQITDDQGATSTSTLTFTVTGTNDAPTAVADNTQATDKATLTVAALNGLLANDTDIDNGTVLTISSIGLGLNPTNPQAPNTPVNGTYGTLIVNPDGSYTYNTNTTASKALNAGQTATETFTYTISDGAGGTSSATLTFTITGSNDAPIATTDSINASDKTPTSANALTGVLSNDSDPDTGATLSVSGITSGTSTPLASNIGISVANTFGSLVLNADGSYTYTPNAASTALAAGQTGIDTFTYQISDNNGDTSTSTIKFTVTGTNDGPTARMDNATIIDKATLSASAATGLLANDTDPDTTDILSVSGVSAGSTGTPNSNVSTPVLGNYGTLTVNPDGSYSYNANTAASRLLAQGQSATDTFSYAISDGKGGQSISSIVFTITGTNDAPTAVADVKTATDKVALIVDSANGLLANDTDPDTGATLTITGLALGTATPTASNIGSSLVNTYGSLSLNNDGSYTYLPNTAASRSLASGQTGVDTFTYQITDDQGATSTTTIKFTVTGTNDAPTAVADTLVINGGSVVNQGVSAGVLVNDTDPDNAATLTVTGVAAGNTPSAGGVGTLIGGTYGNFRLNSDGSYTYDSNTPAGRALKQGQTATDTFIYTITDNNGATSSSSITFTINGTATGPVAVADSKAATQDTILSVNATNGVLANDSDSSGQLFNVSAVSVGNTIPAAANVGNLIVGTYGSLRLNADGSYTYNPNTAASKSLGLGIQGVDTFSYEISNGSDTSRTTLKFTVTGTNDAPTAVADTNTVADKSTLTISAANGLLANDIDVDSTDTLTISGVAVGNATPLAANIGTAITGTYGSLTLNANGSYTYTANTNAAKALSAGQTGVDTFTYQVSDGQGGFSTSTVSLTITGTNDAPVALNDQRAATQQTTLSVSATNGVLANDTDIDTNDSISVSAVSAGTSTPIAANVGTNITGVYGILRLNVDGSYTFNPNTSNAIALGTGQTGVDTFTYQITDSSGATSTARLNFTVTGTNDLPTAVADNYTLNANTMLNATSATGVLFNDQDLDSTDTLSVAAVAVGNGAPNSANVNQPIIGTYGTLTLNANGSFSFNPNTANSLALGAGQTGIDTFTYQISDGNGGLSTSTVKFTVTGTNDAPTAVADTNNATDKVVLNVNATNGVLPNDTDPDNLDTLTVSAVAVGNGLPNSANIGTAITGTYGTLTLNADGSYSFNPNTLASRSLAQGVKGIDTFTYQITDAQGLTSTSTLKITVTGTNDTPTATVDNINANDKTATQANATSGVLINDSDPDSGDALVVSGVAVGTAAPIAANIGQAINNTYGSLTLNSDGSYTYNPNTGAISLANGQTGVDTFTYAVSDGKGGSSSTTIKFTVTGTNDAPSAVADTGSVTDKFTLNTLATNGLLVNDTDPDTGDTIQVSAVAIGTGVPQSSNLAQPINGLYGTLTVNANGSYTYVANSAASAALSAGQTAIDTFTYQITDSSGATSNSTLKLTITGTNDSPSAVADTSSVVDQNTISKTAATGVLSNDFDIDTGDQISVSGVAVSNGTPLAVNVGSGIIGTYGTLILNTDGSYSFNANTAASRALAVGQTGVDTFTYQISDGKGGTSTSTLKITITGTNDAPTAVADNITANDKTPITANAITGLLANDTDIDTGSTLTVSAVGSGTAIPANGVAMPISNTYGTLTVNQDGSYTYTPNAASLALRAGQIGVDTFTYSISDGAGGSSSAQIKFTVTGTNDTPTAVADTNNATDKITISANTLNGVLANDTDPDTGDTLVVSAVAIGTGVPAAVNVGSNITGTYGVLTLNQDGSYTYTPNTAASRALALGQTGVDTFTYEIKDPTGASSTSTLKLTITGTNDAPTASADTNSATDKITLNINATNGVLANDTDPDTGATLTVSAVAAGSNTPIASAVGNNVLGTYGTLILNTDGSYSYTPNTAASRALGLGQTATDTFTYQISDSAGGTSTSTLTLTITGTNDAPTAGADTFVANDRTATSAPAASGVLINDTDPDTGDTLSVSAVGSGTAIPTGGVASTITGTFGSLVLNSDGSYTYTPNAAAIALGQGVQGVDTFTYSVSDGKGGTSNNTIQFTITGTNDAPTAVADVKSATDKIALNVSAANGVLANDTDPDTGATLTVSAVVSGTGTPVAANIGNTITNTYGSLLLNADGSYTYNPNTASSRALSVGQTAVDTFTYQITDDKGAISQTTIKFTVTGTNDAPIAVADNNSLADQTTLSITATNGVLANDTDFDNGAALSVSAVIAGTGTPSTANVGTLITGTYGSLRLNADGSYTFNANTAAGKALGFGQSATDIFTYQVSDGLGGTSTNTLTITVTGTNDAPTAFADTNSATDKTILTVNSMAGVLANDTDPDTDDTLSVSAVALGIGTPNPANVGSSVLGTYGTLILNANGSYTFNPNTTASKALAVGQTGVDTFTYAVSDGKGGSSTNTLTITITGTNDAPTAVADTVAANDKTATTANALTGVLANDVDADTGATLTVSAVAAGTGTPLTGNVANAINNTYGTLTLNANGSYTYTPNAASTALAAGQTGVDTFTYQITDDQGATSQTTIKFTVTGTNDAPTAVADNIAANDKTATTANALTGVLANDVDADTGAILNVSGVAAGTGTPLAGNVANAINNTYGTLTLNANGSYTYTPNSASTALALGQTGVDTFTYQITDDQGATSQTTIKFTVTGTNDAPTAVADNIAANDKTATTANALTGVLANDVDADTGATLTVSGVAAGNGTPLAGNVANAINNTYGTLTLNANGSYTYTPNAASTALAAGQTGVDTFTYQITDDQGATSQTTIKFTVTGTNDAPTAVADNIAANDKTSTTTNALTGVLANDVDADTGATLTVSGVAAGTGTPLAGNVANAINNTYGTLTLNANGSYTYTPNAASTALAAGQTGVDTFTYQITDDQGATSTTTIKFTVTGTNDAPTAVADTVAANDKTATTANALTGVLANDVDADTGATLTVSAVAAGTGTPLAGNVANAINNTYGTLTLNANGSYTYTPNAASTALAAGQTGVDTFTYQITDDQGATSQTTIKFTVTGTNDAPTAVADNIAANDKTATTANALTGVLANDVDTDTGATLTVSAVSAGTGTPLAGNVANAINNTYGTLTLNANGSYTYTPNAASTALAAGQTGVDTFTYQIIDDQGATSTTTIKFTVTGTNDAPTAVADTNTATDKTLLNVNATNGVLINDVDPDIGNTLSVSGVVAGNGIPMMANVGNSVLGTYGSLTLNVDGSYTFNPNTAASKALGLGQTAVDTFTYQVVDNNGATSTSTIKFTVTGTNDAPTAVADTKNATQDITLTLNASNGVLANDLDPDTGDVLNVSAVVAGTGAPLASNVGLGVLGTYGVLTLNNDGSLSYSPNTAASKALAQGQTGVDTFTYAISDGKGGTSTNTITFTVTGTNDAPTATADIFSLNANTTLNVNAATGLLINDTDPDTGDTLTVSAVSVGTGTPIAANVGTPIASTYGTLTVNADGSFSFNPMTASSRALAAGQTATETFTYQISDGKGGTSTNTLKFTVTGTNDAPTAVADSGSVADKATLIKTNLTGLLANDTDLDTTDNLIVSGVIEGTGAPIAANIGNTIVGTYGSLTLNSDGSYSFTANTPASRALAMGQTAIDTFTYEIRDPSGATSTSTLKITITGTNDAPTAVADTNTATDKITLNVNSAQGVLINDIDVDAGTVLSVAAVAVGNNTPLAANVGQGITGTYGTLTLNANGSYSFTPSTAASKALAAGQTGVETFTYQIIDDQGASSTSTLKFTVTGTNDAPTALADLISTATNALLTSTSVNGVLANDIDADTGDTFTLTAVIAGTGTPISSNVGMPITGTYGDLVLNADGSYSYNANNPAAQALVKGQIVFDTFTYQITDSQGATSTTTMTFRIVGGNKAPVAVMDNISANDKLATTANALTGVLANDTDQDNDTLTVIGAAVGNNTPVAANVGSTINNTYGSLTLNSDGSYSYTPNSTSTALGAGQTGVDTFTYQISDINGATSQTTIKFTVTGTNDGPTAVADQFTVNAPTSLSALSTGGLLANDTDPDTTDTLTISGVALGNGTPVSANVGAPINATYGTLTLNTDGSFSFNPNTTASRSLGQGQKATETFTYEISDGKGGTSQATVTFTVNGTNDGPTAVNDNYTVNDKITTTSNALTGILANDTDPDTGDILTVAAVVAGTGSPSASNVGNALSNTYGTLILNANGSYTYTPNAASTALAAGQTGVDTFTYLLTDDKGATSTATIKFTVSGTNDTPTAVADTNTVADKATLNISAAAGVLANDTDPDTTDTLSVSAVAFGNGTPLAANVANAITGTYGTLTLNANGSYSFNANTLASKALAAGQTGVDTFTYQISDNNGATSTNTLKITITGTNDAPTATADTAAANDKTATTANALTGVLANDVDADTGATLTVSGVAAGTGTPLAGNVANPINNTYGTLTLNANGSYTYTPNAASTALAAGQTGVDTFTYQITDDQGATSQTTIKFTVTGTNDAPTAVADNIAANDKTVTTTNALTGVLANDVDADTGATLTVSAVAAGTGTPLAGNVANAINNTYGTLTLNANGSYTYTPNAASKALAAGQIGVDTFTYQISDDQGATSQTTIKFTVTGTNDAPTAIADNIAANDKTATTANALTGVLANDVDADTGATLIVSAISVGTGAPVSANVGNPLSNTYGTLTLNANGSYTYTPNAASTALAAGQTGVDTFTYQITDDQGATSQTTIRFTVTGTNDAPTAVADTNTVADKATLNISAAAGVLANDTDPDTTNTLSVSAVAIGNNTPMAANVASALTATYGTLTLNANGSYSFNANTLASKALGVGQSAVETFTYQISDGFGGTSQSTLQITITGTNDGPSAVNDNYSTLATATLNANTSTGTLFNDTDPDTTDILHVSAVAVSNGTPLAANVGTGLTGTYGTLTLNADGSFAFNPNTLSSRALAAGQTGIDTFTYQISDNNGGLSTATVTFTVTGTNDAPTAVADTVAANDKTATTANALTGALANDLDVDTGATLTVSGVVAGTGTPLAGNVANPINNIYGTLTLNANGSYTYTPNAASTALAAGQTGVDTFTYQITDDQGATSTTTIKFTVTGTNDAPTAVADTNTVADKASLNVASTSGVLINDTDPDTTDTLTVSAVVAGTGSPVGANVGTGISGTYGVLTLNSNGAYTFTANTMASKALAVGQTGVDTFTYQISDGKGGTSQSTLNITITGTNDAPTAVADTVAANDKTATTTNALTGVLANDVDADTGATLTVSAVVAGTGTPLAGNVANAINNTYGTLTLNANGSYTYTPNAASTALGAGQTGVDTFTYQITDDQGATSTTTIKFTVTGTNDAPTAVADNNAATDKITLTVDSTSGVLINDIDPDTTDTLTVAAVVAGTGAPVGANVGTGITGTYGVLTLNSNGSYTYTPNTAASKSLAAGQTGVDTFTYQISDGKGGTSQSTLNLTVTGTNDAPTAVADNFNATQQTTISTSLRANGVLGNDTDPDTGETATLIISGVVAGTGAPVAGNVGNSVAGTYGMLTLNNDGTYSYNPSTAAAIALATGQTGVDTFTYEIKDASGLTSTTTIKFTVTGTNDAPTAVADVNAATQGSAISVAAGSGVLINDVDPDTIDMLTVAAVAVGAGSPSSANVGTGITGTYGILTLNANGSYSYNPNTPAAIALGLGATAVDTFTYQVSDGKGGTSTSTLTITVTGTNDTPVANTDAISATQSAALNLNAASGVLINDTDPDTGDTLTVVGVINGGTGSPNTNVGTPVAGVYGDLVLNADGSLSYLASKASAIALGVGQTAVDVFRYAISDGKGGTAFANINFTITGTNDGPTAVADINNATDKVVLNVSNTAGVLINDTDPDTGDILSVSAVVAGTGSPVPANVGNAILGAYGTLTLNTNGSYSYNPNTAASKALGAGQTAIDTFTYAISDGKGGTSQSTLNLTVTGVNDAPTATNDANSATEDILLNVNAASGVLINDTDADTGDTFTVAAVIAGTGAPLTANLATPVTGTYGILTLNADGSYIYNPNTAASQALAAGSSAVDTFTYQIKDAAGATSNATISFTVTGTNDAPVAAAGSVSGSEDTPYVFTWADFSSRISDVDTALTSLRIVLDTLPTNGTLLFNGVAATIGQIITKADLDAGRLVFTPAANQSGDASFLNAPFNAQAGSIGNLKSSLAQFNFHANDGAADSNMVNMNINITPVKDGAVTNASFTARNEVFNTSWEANEQPGFTNSNNTSEVYTASQTFGGWTLVTADPNAGGITSFEVWTGDGAGGVADDAPANDATAAGAGGGTSANTVFQTARGYEQAPITINGGAVNNGINSIELNDATTNIAQTIGVERTITTNLGAVYSINFDYAGRAGYNTDYTNIRITIDGVVYNFADQGRLNFAGNTRLDWGSLSITFVGTGNPVNIKFETAPVTVQASGRGALFDDLTVAEFRGAIAGNANSGANTQVILKNYFNTILADNDGSEGVEYDILASTLPPGSSILVNGTAITAVGGKYTLKDGDLANAILQFGSTFIGNFNLQVETFTYEKTQGPASRGTAVDIDMITLKVIPSADQTNLQTNLKTAPTVYQNVLGSDSDDSFVDDGGAGAAGATVASVSHLKAFYGFAGNDAFILTQNLNYAAADKKTDGQADKIVFLASDVVGSGTGTTAYTKYISGFDGASALTAVKGDILDMRDLLQGETKGANNLGNMTNYIDIVNNGNNTNTGHLTTFRISTKGLFAGGAYTASVHDLTIIFDETFNTAGTTTAATFQQALGLAATATEGQIITAMIQQGKLITD